MIIYLYIFHENSLLTLEIICLISTLYIIIYLTSLHCFYYVVFNVGYRQYQSHAIINYHYHMFLLNRYTITYMYIQNSYNYNLPTLGHLVAISNIKHINEQYKIHTSSTSS